MNKNMVFIPWSAIAPHDETSEMGDLSGPVVSAAAAGAGMPMMGHMIHFMDLMEPLVESQTTRPVNNQITILQKMMLQNPVWPQGNPGIWMEVEQAASFGLMQPNAAADQGSFMAIPAAMSASMSDAASDRIYQRRADIQQKSSAAITSNTSSDNSRSKSSSVRKPWRVPSITAPWKRGYKPN